MPARGQHGSKAPRSRKAAELYLDDGLTIAALCERFGLARGTIWTAVDRLRRERRSASPT